MIKLKLQSWVFCYAKTADLGLEIFDGKFIS